MLCLAETLIKCGCGDNGGDDGGDNCGDDGGDDGGDGEDIGTCPDITMTAVDRE